MRVLGIDPGLTRCGLGVIDSRGSQILTMIDVGVIRTTVDAPLEIRLMELERELQQQCYLTGQL